MKKVFISMQGDLTPNSFSAEFDGTLLQPIEGPELVFGLVGPIGTELGLVADKLEGYLKSVRYNKVHHIRVTKHLKDLKQDLVLEEEPLFTRYQTYISAGNEVRKLSKLPNVLIVPVLARIRQLREMRAADKAKPDEFTAYIVNQLKRPEEVQTLRQIYGRGFVLISVYCSKDIRRKKLADRMRDSDHDNRKKRDAYLGQAQELINIDENEEGEYWGQRVRDTFPLGDVFINADNEEKITETLQRFIRCFFSDNFVTPTRDEYGIFLARSVSYRSSDLSRQVGAVVLRKTGEVVCAGCNEVPKSGGGTYWEGDTGDSRDFQLGFDTSQKRKVEIVEDAIGKLKAAGWLSTEKSDSDTQLLVGDAILSEDAVLRDAEIMDILEFGRIVHAEMSAISDAARLGLALQNTTLYCTTFPCHICARHIVAAGIRRVVYIEPYPKSYVAELYEDSISVEGLCGGSEKVSFEPFVGLAPERFAEVYRKGKRKDGTGKAINWEGTNAKPIVERYFPDYLVYESAFLSWSSKILSERGLMAESGDVTWNDLVPGSGET